jgi:hypothetical protein
MSNLSDPRPANRWPINAFGRCMCHGHLQGERRCVRTVGLRIRTQYSLLAVTIALFNEDLVFADGWRKPTSMAPRWDRDRGLGYRCAP